VRRPCVVLSLVILITSLTGCGDSGVAASGTASPTGMAAPVTGPIVVLAAASLTESFTTLGEQFEQQHPGTTVSFSFAGSSALAAQIEDGSPADVFASASSANMDQVVASGDATSPITFATNSMQIATSPDNPGRVDSLDDLADPSVKTAVCQPQVPCGVAAEKAFANAGITVSPVTLEPDVKAVLSKVRLDEVDAGMVYVTDVLAAGHEVAGVAIPADVNASTAYPIARLHGSTNPATAQAFVEYVLSPAGESVLTAAGFAQP